jgi:hypothetical protein
MITALDQKTAGSIRTASGPLGSATVRVPRFFRNLLCLIAIG